MATVGRLDWRTFISADDKTPTSIIKALDDYFDCFAQIAVESAPDGTKTFGENPCVKCDEIINPGLAGFLLGKGGFTWGLAHGEGHCKNCGWPARGIHYIRGEDGNAIVTLRNMVLQYHPDFVTDRKSA